MYEVDGRLLTVRIGRSELITLVIAPRRSMMKLALAPINICGFNLAKLR